MGPTLGPWASTALVIFYILSSVVLLSLIAAVGYLVWRLNTILERYEGKIEPVLNKADAVLTLIGEKTDSIGGKAEHLLSQGEEMAGSVHEKVDQTATIVQRTVNAPIIGINSFATAVTEGLTMFTRLQKRIIQGTEPVPATVSIKEADIVVLDGVSGEEKAVCEESSVSPEVRPEQTETNTVGIVGSTVTPINRPAVQEDAVRVVVGRKG